MATSPLNYSDVADMYSAYTDAVQTTETLPEYAARMNTETGSRVFDPGLEDSWVKKASHGIDVGLRATGIPKLTGAIGAGIGSIFGEEEAGRAAGEGLPRGLVNFAPMLALSLISGPLPAIAYVGGAGLTGLLSGSDTYTQTGSMGAGLISGAINTLISPVASLGGQIALRSIGAPLLERGGLRVATNLAQRLTSYAGGQAAALTAFELAGEAQSYVTGDGLYNPLTKAHLVESAIGQVPFAIHDIHRVVKAPDIRIPFVKTDAAANEAEVARRNQVNTLPEVPREFGPQPLSVAIVDYFKELSEIKADKSLSQEAKQGMLDKLQAQYASWMSRTNPKAETVEEGNASPTTTRVGVPLDQDTVTLQGVIDRTNRNDAGEAVSHFINVEGADRLGFAGKRMQFPEHESNVFTDLDNGKAEVKVSKKFLRDAPWEDRVPATLPPEEIARLQAESPDLPVQANWRLAEEQRRLDSVNRHLQVLGQEAAKLHEVDIRDLNDAHEVIKGADDIRAAAGDATPTTDAQLRVELDAELEAAKGDVNVAADKVARKRVAKAENLVEEKKKVNKRKQQENANAVKAVTTYGELVQRVTEAKRSKKLGELSQTEHNDAQDLSILKRRMEKVSSSTEGRMDQAEESMQKAYVNWMKEDQQNELVSKAGGENAKPEVLNKVRASSLEALLNKVEETAKISKVITGGKVLKADGTWGKPDKTFKNLMFDTKEAALAELEKHKKDGIEGMDFDSVKPMPRKGKFYLQERPRKNETSLNKLQDDLGVEKEGGMTQAEQDSTPAVDLEFDKLTGVKSVPNSTVALESLREHDVSRKDMVDVLSTKVAALDEETVWDVLDATEKGYERDKVPAFKSQVSIWMKAVSEKEIPTGRLSEGEADRLGTMFKDAGVPMDTITDVQNFANSSELKRVNRMVAEEVMRGNVLPPEPKASSQDVTRLLGKAERERITKFGLDQTPAEAIERLSKMFSPNSLTSAVLKLFKEHIDLLKDVKFNLVLDKPSGGSYNKHKNLINIGTYFLGKGSMDVELAQVVLHETAHSMTQKAIEQNPNHPMVKELERLRKQVVAQLPPEVRAMHEDAQKSKMYDRYLRDEIPSATYKNLEDGSPWHDVLYGLENLNEFVAQMFSSHDMQSYLQGLKSPASKSLFRRAIEAIASYFGKNTENMLYQSMAATTRLFDRQRTLLRFEDVINPMLRKAGVLTKDLTVRAGAIYRVLEMRPIGLTVEERSGNIIDRMLRSYNNSLEEGAGLSSYERRDHETGIRLQGMEDTSAQTMFDLHKDFELYEPKTVEGMVTDAVKNLSPKELQQYMELSPLSHSYIAKAVADHALLNLDMLTKIDDAARAGLLSVSPLNAKAYDMAKTKFESVLKAVEKVHADNVTLAKLQSIEPLGFLTAQQDNMDRLVKAPKFSGSVQMAEDMNMAGPATKLGRTFKNVFMPSWQYAKLHPVSAPMIELSFSYQSRVKRFVAKNLLPFFTKDGELSNKAQQDFEKFSRDKFLTDKVDALIRLRQDKNGLMDYSDPKDKSLMDSVLQGLTPEQRKRVLEVSDQQTVSMVDTQKDIIAHEQLIGEASLATIIQRKSNLGVADNRMYAQNMLEAMRQMQNPDPAMQNQGHQTLLRLQNALGAEGFPKFLEFAEREVGRIQRFQDFFADRPWFATEQNFNKFVIRFKNNGKAGRVDGETLAEARASLAKNYPGAEVIQEIHKQDPNDPNRNYGMNQRMLDKLDQFQSEYIESLKQAGVDQVEIDAAQENSMTASLRREMAANALYKPGSERKGALGRELLPMLKNHFNYVSAVGNAINKRLTRQELWLVSNDPALREFPEQRAQGIRHVENFLAPDSEAGRMLSQMNFHYYLGLNLSSHVIEGGQSMLSHVAQLTAEGAGILGSYNRVFSAAGAIKDWAIGTKGQDAKGRDLGWSNPEHSELMYRAKLDGEIGMGMWDETIGHVDQAAINMMRNTSGNDGFTMSDLVKKPLAAYKHVAANLYGIFTHFNARLALLSSFDMYRAKGLSFDEAYQKAREFNRTANFSGGRAARSIGLFDTRGQMRTASMVVSSLQSYQLGMISMFHRFFSHGFGKGDPSLTVADRGNARKAALQLFATQLGAAGVMGLPFVAAGVALLEQLFPDLELKKNIRLFASQALADDKEANGLLTNIALQGVPSQLGVDVQSRLGIGGNIAGLSEYNGFDPKNILGPTYNLFRNLAVGVSQASSGNVLGGVQQMLPPAYKKAIDLYRNSGAIRSPSGQLLLQPSPGEQFAYAIGFRPKQVADSQEADRMLKRSDEIRRREVEQFHQETAAKVLSGDATGARRDLVSRAEADQTFDIRAGARAVAAAVERRTMPEDPRRGGNLSGGQDRSKLLATYSLPQQPPSELSRLQLRKAVEKSLGVPGAGLTSLTETRVASRVDQLMTAHPALSRSQARHLAEQEVGAVHAPASLLQSFSE